MPRIAPPPLGSEIVGGARAPSFAAVAGAGVEAPNAVRSSCDGAAGTRPRRRNFATCEPPTIRPRRVSTCGRGYYGTSGERPLDRLDCPCPEYHRPWLALILYYHQVAHERRALGVDR